jgi:hypothetical protein
MVTISSSIGGGLAQSPLLNPTSWIIIIATLLSVGGIVLFFAYNWFKQKYNIDIEIKEERASGNPVVRYAYGRRFEEEGVRKINIMTLRNWKGIMLPAPTLDVIEMQSNGRLKVTYWCDVFSNFHQMKFTKKVPIYDFDEQGNVVKMSEEEIIFAPDSSSYRQFAIQELRRVWNRYKEADWWGKYGAITTIGIVAGVSNAYSAV